MAIVTMTSPPIRKKTAVELTRKWSNWGKGDIIIMDEKKANNMIAKKYGHIVSVPKPEPPKKKETPIIETAVDPGPSLAEKAVESPQDGELSRPSRRRRGGE